MKYFSSSISNKLHQPVCSDSETFCVCCPSAICWMVYPLASSKPTHFSQCHLFSVGFLSSAFMCVLSHVVVCAHLNSKHRLDDYISIPPSILIFRCQLNVQQCVRCSWSSLWLSHLFCCNILPPFGLRKHIHIYLDEYYPFIFMLHIILRKIFVRRERASCVFSANRLNDFYCLHKSQNCICDAQTSIETIYL